MKFSWLFRDRLGRRGIAALEFALIMPVLLVMFIGTVEVLTLYRTEGKLNALAFNVAQMVSMEPTPTTLATANQTSLNDICTGAVLGFAPYPPNGLTIKIASVTLEPSALSSETAGTPVAYDEWEAQSVVTGRNCATTATNGIGATNAELLATTNPPSLSGTSGTTGAVEVPCDNMIIVQASITYPGLTGVLLKNARPVLSQTVYTRFRYASPTEQLNCSNCSLNPATQLNYCNTNSTANN